jgi:hypothetical protein
LMIASKIGRVPTTSPATSFGKALGWERCPHIQILIPLHALLSGGHPHHDHGAELKELLRLVLRAGIHCHFYDVIG